ncbi:MAG: hypothetical protein OES38_07100 [Gammaproteobacteria bacterium]|nr:hypothetical protein [Gammaproteobacteria bacterium]
MKPGSRFIAPLRATLWTTLLLGSGAAAEVDLTDYQDDAQVRFAFEHLTLSYPATWSLADATPPMVLYVEARSRLPAMRVMVLDEPFWLPLNFATRAASTALNDLGRDIELKGEQVEDWNGMRVNVGEVHWTMNIGLGLPLRSLFVSTFHNDKWILLNMITGPGEDEFPESLLEVARTLAVEE